MAEQKEVQKSTSPTTEPGTHSPVSGTSQSLASGSSASKASSQPDKLPRADQLYQLPISKTDLASSSAMIEARQLMPPPPVPATRQPAPTKVTTLDVVTVFAASRVLSELDEEISFHTIDVERYRKLINNDTIATLNGLCSFLANAVPNYRQNQVYFIDRILQELREPRSEERTRFVRAFECTRENYLNEMTRYCAVTNEGLRRPLYNWVHLIQLIHMSAEVAKETARLRGKRNIYNDVIEWCIYLIRSWHMDVWLVHRGGWEAILEDARNNTLLDEVQIVIGQERLSEKPTSSSAPTTSTGKPPSSPPSSPAEPTAD